MLDASSEGMICFDSDGRILNWNEKAVELLKSFDSQSVGFMQGEFINPPQLRETLLQLIDSLRQQSPKGGLPKTTVFRFRNTLGSLVTCELVITGQPNSNFYTTLIHVRPSESVDIFPSGSASAESSGEAIIEKSLDGKIIRWTQGAELLYGYRENEILGQSSSILMPADQEQEEPELILVALHGIRLNQFETIRRRRDGKRLHVSMTVTPLLDDDGKIIGTSSVETETATRKSREDHGQRVTPAIELADRTKSEFLANVSHELRTPMNAIIGMLDLSLVTDELPLIVREYLQTASESAHVLLSLLDDLLDFSRMETGHFELELQAFSLRQVLEESIRILALKAHERGIELACDIHPDVPDRLEGDARRLRQILMNLVGNAIKFTEQGEVVVRVAIERRHDVSLQLLLSVQDTGIGIAAEDQERIFYPFAQADTSTTRRFAGSGLGLSICRELVERMDGQIWLDSRLGRGTTFYCTPRFRVLNELAGDDLTATSSLKDLPVLIIDDNGTSRQILESLLKSWSMNVTTFSNGLDAFERLQELAAEGSPPPMVIVDALMPEMDGFEFIDLLSQQDFPQGPTILMLSSADRSRFDGRCRNIPVNGFLEKPIAQSLLLGTVLSAAGSNQTLGNAQGNNAATPKSLNILVAEDTPANQRVVRAILERRGHHVIIAHNGREAVDLLEKTPVDVLLMDVQMPTMDGLQATSAIRSLRSEVSSVPIIAMTAHAMPGDRDRCLAAGMDEYISKPIDARQLVLLVESATRTQRIPRDRAPKTGPVSIQIQMQQGQQDCENRPLFESSRSGAQGAGVRTFMSSPEFRSNLLGDGKKKSDGTGVNEKPILNVAASLARLGGDASLLSDMARFFLEDADQLYQDLLRAFETNNTELAYRSAHSLKGLSANFNAEPCVTAAMAVEESAKQRKLESSTPVVVRLRTELDRLIAALRREVLHEVAPPSASGGTSPPPRA